MKTTAILASLGLSAMFLIAAAPAATAHCLVNVTQLGAVCQSDSAHCNVNVGTVYDTTDIDCQNGGVCQVNLGECRPGDVCLVKATLPVDDPRTTPVETSTHICLLS